jgi:hypothetical protein
MNIDKQIEQAEQKYKEAELAYIEAFHEWNHLLVRRTKETRSFRYESTGEKLQKKYNPVKEVR